MTSTNICKTYIGNVKSSLCNLSSANEFINMLTDDVQEYIDNNPGCTYNELVEQFGRPEDIAQDYLSETDNVQPQKLIKSNKKKILIICLLVGALIIGGLYLLDMHMNDQAKATDVITVYDN